MAKDKKELIEKYISNDATTEEKQLLGHIITENQELSEALLHIKMERDIALSTNEMSSDKKNDMLKNIRESIGEDNFSNKKYRNRRLLSALKIASMILLPILSASAVYLFVRPAQSNPVLVSVEQGQQAQVQLPDGSKVWLNSQSSISYPSDFAENRRITLEGEAYFEVAKVDGAQFCVLADDINIEVLGTKFVVKSYPNDNYITTTLISGKIELSSPDSDVMMAPNQRVVYNRKDKRLVKNDVINSENYVSWINNKFYFDNESLEDIASSIMRMYNVEIFFDSDEARDIRFTGTIGNSSIDSVLNIISLTSPIYYKIDQQNVYIYLNKNNSKYFQ